MSISFNLILTITSIYLYNIYVKKISKKGYLKILDKVYMGLLIDLNLNYIS